MLNILWPILIIFSYIYAITNGNIEGINKAVFEYTESAVKLLITLCGTMCLWSGLMEIALNTRLIKRITKLLNPNKECLFFEEHGDKKIKQEKSRKKRANLLGPGNAATPLGIKAMKSMQEKNKNKEILTNDMAMFILLNTASIQIIPTTVIGIRMNLGSLDPTNIIFPVWISTICAAIVGITVVKLCIKLKL